jgi:NAD(P)-dependent dehydrogenase (short-subunit alcohol dehydrogenase family)
MTSLLGKWSLVTGASRGVGSHLSEGLAKLGSNVILHSRELSHTQALATRIGRHGVNVVTVSGELSDQAQVDAMLDAALKQAGRIDILYNNAAIMTPWKENPWDIPAEDFRASFEVNVISLARICYRLVPPMLARKWGRVINLTSGIMNEPNLTAYAISKAAVDKFVRDFVPRLAGTGVNMNLLDPGWLRTDLGGPRAPNDPSTVLPGALVPALLDNGESGRFFRAQDYAGLSLEQALEKARLK